VRSNFGKYEDKNGKGDLGLEKELVVPEGATIFIRTTQG
jgi:hypothetical protein